MNERKAKFCRDVAAIAKVCGERKIYTKRNMRRRQLAKYKGYVSDQGFPKKVPGKGWSREAVQAWWDRKCNHAVPTINGALVFDADQIERDSLSALVEIYRTRRRRLTSDEIELLVKQKVIKRGEYESGAIEVKNQRHMAELIQQKFGIGCTEQDISNWTHSKNLPKILGVEIPNFPLPRTRGGWKDAREGFEWFDKYIYQPTKKGGSQSELTLGSRASDARLWRDIYEQGEAKIKFENAQREHDAKWLLRDTATATVISIVSGLLSLIEQEYERNAPKLRLDRLRGIVPDAKALAKFHEDDVADERARIDRIRAECANRSRRTEDGGQKPEIRSQKSEAGCNSGIGTGVNEL